MYSSHCRSATTRERSALQRRCIAAGFNAEIRYQAMQRFSLQTIEPAPEESRSTLQALQQSLGFLPNVIATMANSPVLLNGFAGSFGSFHGGSLNEIERQVVLLTNAVAIKCPLTVAIHSTFAIEDGIAESEVKAVRDGKLHRDRKYAALSDPPSSVAGRIPLNTPTSSARSSSPRRSSRDAASPNLSFAR
jgi:hypothetical protein